MLRIREEISRFENRSILWLSSDLKERDFLIILLSFFFTLILSFSSFSIGGIYFKGFIINFSYIHFPILVCYLLTGVSILCFVFVPLIYVFGFRRTILEVPFGVFCIITFFIMIYISSLKDFGSDMDEAIILGIKSLLEFQFPYYARTQLNNPISPFPGAFLIYMPFYILFGEVNILNYLSFAFIVIFLYRKIPNTQIPFLAFFNFLFFNSFSFNQIIYSSDYIFYLALSVVIINCLKKHKILSAAFLTGLLLASRGYFILLGGLSFGYLIKNKRKSYDPIVFFLIALITFSMIILPFLIWDFDYFFNVAPLGVDSRKFNIPNNYLSGFAFYIFPITGGLRPILLILTLQCVSIFVGIRISIEKRLEFGFFIIQSLLVFFLLLGPFYEPLWLFHIIFSLIIALVHEFSDERKKELTIDKNSI